MSAVSPLVMPQLNVNDESVLLLRWTKDQHGAVTAGEVVCEVETSKAVAEVTAIASGVLVQAATPPLVVRIGDHIGAIASTFEEAEKYLAARQPQTLTAGDATVAATPRARALAEQSGVSIETVARAGVHGTVKESDVRTFVAAMTSRAAAPRDAAKIEQTPLSSGLLRYVEPAGFLSSFERAVAANLRRSTSQLILTSVDADCRIAAAQSRIQTLLAGGRMVSLLQVLIAAAAKALPKFPRLMSVVHEGAVYRYRAVDVAFVVRAADGRLYTPVVRAADGLDLAAIATACQAVTLRILRGTAKAEELEGGCFTISHVAVAGTTRVVALPSFGQSAVLGVSAERSELEMVGGVVVPRPYVTLTLTYDHTTCDGVYAAMFLNAVVADVEGAA